MKELLNGIWSLIWASLVTFVTFGISTIYSLLYAIWLSITLKDWLAFFKFIWRIIDGFAAAIGHALYNIAYSLDLIWNVNGEILEDIITAKEDTEFNKKNITVSATIGKLEIDGDLNKTGKNFSKLLNFFFNQKQHAIDAWHFTKERKKVKNKYFDKLGKRGDILKNTIKKWFNKKF